jgi:hypothetical protein
MDAVEIVEQIRSYLAVAGRPWNDELADLAAEYAGLCREANERLRRCGQYLRRGMRSEAVHLADCLPPLAEIVRCLQFPETEQWAAACHAAGMPAAAPLQAAELDNLESARAQEQVLQYWVARQRILALARAPVRERLSLARAIAEKDPDSPCWQSNIRDLESARLPEMHLEAKQAFRERNANALETAVAELTGHAWLTSVPDDLRRGLEAALKKVRHDAAMVELKGLLLQVLGVYETRNYDQCAALMSTWQAQVDSRHLVLPPELQAQIRPVAAWLATETRSRGIDQRMKALQPILKAGEEKLRRQRIMQRFIRIGLAIGATAAVAAAGFFLIHTPKP